MFLYFISHFLFFRYETPPVMMDTICETLHLHHRDPKHLAVTHAMSRQLQDIADDLILTSNTHSLKFNSEKEI